MIMETSKERAWAVISHLGGLVFVFLLPILIPLMIWLLKGDASSFLNVQSKEALNFQISLFIYSCIIVFLCFTVIGAPFAWLGYIIFAVTNFICSIKGAIWTARGKPYRYPFNLRLIP